MKKIIVLGSTGSIGRNALAVVRGNQERISVAGLSSKANIDLLEKQIAEFSPFAVSVWEEEQASALQKRIGAGTKVFWGINGLLELVDLEADLVVSALVGIVGLRPMIQAIKTGKNIAIANKEVLVAAGGLLVQQAKEKGVSIIPIDSEHSALMQCFWQREPSEIKKIIITASGGPFYNRGDKDLSQVTPEEALAHPTWQMGKKVTIDSATLMNKGFEVIEASYLFGISTDKIEVVIHPESIIHALVEFIDGSVIALMHVPDMRVPIQYAITWPERWSADYGTLDLTSIRQLNFSKPEKERFPALELAYSARRIGGTLPAVLSAADEECVEKFLQRKLSFSDIITTIKRVMRKHKIVLDPTWEDMLTADNWARMEVQKIITNYPISNVK